MRRWRPMTWVILVVNVLMVVWLVSGIASVANNPSACTGLDQSTCDSARAAGGAIGAAFIIFLWAALDIILGIVWLVTNRRKGRDCPVCGSDVKRGVTVCKKCGHDFAAAARPQPPAPPANPSLV